MGAVKNISHELFPCQGPMLNKRVRVCFHHDTRETIKGTVVRDDVEEPMKTIIKLDDDRYVLATECMYGPI